METLSIDLPAMYGDHHVVEVRRIIQALPGVEDVYASSAFRIVEITFDPAMVTPEILRNALEEAGYSGDLPVPVESHTPANETAAEDSFFRHSAVYEHTRQVVSFAQNVAYSGRPLWPCPGMGPIRANKVVEE